MKEVIQRAGARPGASTTSISPVQREGLVKGDRHRWARLGLASNYNQRDSGPRNQRTSPGHSSAAVSQVGASPTTGQKVYLTHWEGSGQLFSTRKNV